MPSHASRQALPAHGKRTSVLTTFGATGHQEIPLAARARIVQSVRDAIARAAEPVSVITSLAAGADQLVAQEMLAAGGALLVVTPCKGYERTFSNSSNRSRFEAVMRRASDVERLDFAEPSEDAFWAAGRRVVDRCDVLLAIWDGAPARGLGGTADVVRYAREQDVRVQVLWPDGITR